MDARSWLRAVAAQVPWGGKYSARLLTYADHVAAACPASSLTEDLARDLAARLQRFPTLAELIGEMAAVHPEIHQEPSGGRALSPRAGHYEVLLLKRLAAGVDPSTVLSMAGRYAEPGVWERLAAAFAPDLLSAELQRQRERAGRLTRCSPRTTAPG
ncbi:hypothetical protein J8J14_23730 [Roseomonas sp. SSH11]|uniref:Uncharacterized protein n=1 Tax=Pararoseomonas baculiformis TaxID=2820812 RepID=A0ABS4AL59_9PROT|nr:hypothetical protein [Pararoseomonas baculiformis]MBP0447762.1 hypothetical protein [Pararoseomonas baculiformis]